MASSSVQLAAFVSFFENWLKTHEALFQQLETILSQIDGYFDSNKECTDIISRVSSHYQEFYNQKAKAAKENIMLFLSPTWLTSFERSLLWISGFKPGSLFRLVERSVGPEELSGEQKRWIEAARGKTRRKERNIASAMARVHETVAEQPFYEHFRKLGKTGDGEKWQLEELTAKLKAAMFGLVAEADALVQSTAVAILEVLNPVQGVKFFAATMRFQLQARKLGLEKDGSNGMEFSG